MSTNFITIAGGDSPVFLHHSPKADGINAVKLTDKNIRSIASHMLETFGGTVQVDDSSISAGPPSPVDGRPAGFEFAVGEWVVKEYDYENDMHIFRLATLDERKKYDLR